MLWHNNGVAGTHDGIIGHDFECHKCTECGGFPIRVDYDFDVKGEHLTAIVRGEKKPVSKERRSYYHCICGHSTTDWMRPERNKDGVIVKAAWLVARDAYQKGCFIK